MTNCIRYSWRILIAEPIDPDHQLRSENQIDDTCIDRPEGTGIEPMITRRKLLKAGLLTVGTMALGQSSLLSAAPDGYGIKGAFAPELDIDYWIDKNGKPTRIFKLADHKGKWVFLKCFQNWCPGCHSHGLPAAKKISEAMAGNDQIVFAGIQTAFEGHGINTVDKIRDIQLQYDLKMPMGHDPGEINGGRPKTMTSYRTGGTPWMILISPDRQVVYNDFGINADRAIEFLKTVTT